MMGDWIGRSATHWPHHVAVVDPYAGERLTYAALDDRASRLAGFFQSRGVKKGDAVGVLLRNGVEMLDVLFACGKLGAIFTPYNWRLHAEELSELVSLTRPRVFLYDTEFSSIVRHAALATALPEAQLEVGPPAPAGSGAHAGDLASCAYSSALAHASIARAEATDPEDIAAYLFTGGTSGTPKAARISHRMIAWNTLNTLVHELDRTDVGITHAPMFHAGGLFVYTLPLLTIGARVVLMRQWHARDFLSLVERERVTVFFCVPAQYAEIVDLPEFARTDLRAVRFVTCGGAPLPVALIEKWRHVHATPFKQGFGMTEFGPGAFSMGPEYAVSKAGSIGRPNYFVDARVVDETGDDVAAGETGELLLRGPGMFSGYQSKTGILAPTPEDGWLRTGDLARVDPDGFYFIAGRKKEMFISGGENIYPVEIEQALATHPAVSECAVVGVPDPRWGEAARAFVVLRNGAVATEADLLEHARTKIARYKVPKQIVLRAELPRSGAGKILRRVLREECV